KTLKTVNEAFQDEYPDDEIPARQTIYRLATKFDETGSVEDAPRSGRPTSITTEENMQLVSESYTLNPQKSQRHAAHDLDISRSSVRRIMKELNLKPYKSRLLQALHEDDPDRRLEFSQWALDSIREDPIILDRILWTDEAIFQTNARVNRHDYVY
ncbi:unnamed protein product, partial [Rotaria sp. Silwood2]